MDREGDSDNEEYGDDNGDEVICGDGVSDEDNSDADGEESGNDVNDDEESGDGVSDDEESGDGVSDDGEDDSEPRDDNVVICKARRCKYQIFIIEIKLFSIFHYGFSVSGIY